MSRIGHTILLLAAGCGRVGFGESPDPADPDLVARFSMDTPPSGGQVANAVPGAVGATCMPCPDLTPGVHGNGFVFDGSSQALRVPGTSLDVPHGTLAMFVRLDSMPASVVSFATKAYGPDKSNSWELFIDPTNQHLVVGSDAATDHYVDLVYPRALGVWMHLAMTWNETSFRLFVDGALHDESAFEPAFDGSDVVLGGDLDFGAVVNFLPGALDEVELYRRELAADEISELAKI